VPRSAVPPSSPSPRTPAADPAPRSRARSALVALLVVEAVAVGAGGVLGIGAVVRGGHPAVAASMVVCALAVAAALLACARSFRRGSSRARGPAATWQLLQGATAVTLLQAGASPWVAGTALAVAAAGLVLIVTRPAPPTPVL
jgi:hypothetical protein